MVKIFKASKSTKLVGQSLDLTIERLDINGLGVAQHKGKPIFVAQALPLEKVKAKVTESKSKYSKAKLLSVSNASPIRVEPQCKHFSQCGGCDLQHISVQQQHEFKQQKIADLFARHGIHNLPWQEVVHDSAWHYRRKARIGVQYNKLGQAIVGFRKKLTNEITPIKQCPILDSSLEHVFSDINQVLSQLSQEQAIGHIEVFATSVTTLVIRQLQTLTEQDREVWSLAAQQHHWQVFFDDGKQATPILTDSAYDLSYALNNGIQITFRPTDFIQVNNHVNNMMVTQAVDWLAVEATDQVLDLFCGLGNFSLAIAKQAKSVIGVEGVAAMSEQAQLNAQYNQIDNCQFYHANLNDDWQQQAWAQHPFNKILLDPARAGAYEACQQLIHFQAKEIVYVSCDPTTLARDSQLLIEAGYEVKKIALIDMFSQTKHVETMVLFQKK